MFSINSWTIFFFLLVMTSTKTMVFLMLEILVFSCYQPFFHSSLFDCSMENRISFLVGCIKFSSTDPQSCETQILKAARSLAESCPPSVTCNPSIVPIWNPQWTPWFCWQPANFTDDGAVCVPSINLRICGHQATWVWISIQRPLTPKLLAVRERDLAVKPVLKHKLLNWSWSWDVV